MPRPTRSLWRSCEVVVFILYVEGGGGRVVLYEEVQVGINLVKFWVGNSYPGGNPSVGLMKRKHIAMPGDMFSEAVYTLKDFITSGAGVLAGTSCGGLVTEVASVLVFFEVYRRFR